MASSERSGSSPLCRVHGRAGTALTRRSRRGRGERRSVMQEYVTIKREALRELEERCAHAADGLDKASKRLEEADKLIRKATDVLDEANVWIEPGNVASVS